MAHCKKEKALTPDNQEEEYLVVTDNPSDPVDHAIYGLYRSTGIPCFYNDTIHRKKIGDSAGIPLYSYIKLATAYSPQGVDQNLHYTLLKNKQVVLPLLDLLQNELLPRVSNAVLIPSILFTDTLRTYYYQVLPQSIWIGLNAYRGFNTVAIRTVNPDTMDAEERNRYIASILSVLAIHKLINTQSKKLENDVYSLSKAIAPDCYNNSLSNLSPDGTKKPEDFGLIYYYELNGSIYTPLAADDTRAFLEAVCFYSPAAFNAKYSGYPVVLEKFRVVRAMVEESGFRLPN